MCKPANSANNCAGKMEFDAIDGRDDGELITVDFLEISKKYLQLRMMGGCHSIE